MKILWLGLLALFVFSETTLSQPLLADPGEDFKRSVARGWLDPLANVLGKLKFTVANSRQAQGFGMFRDTVRPIDATKVVHIAIRTDDPPRVAGVCGGSGGSGLPNDPCDGSSQAKFDAIMAAQSDDSAVYLGEGLFETKGAYSWILRKGMHLIGSGMDKTTLKQVFAPLTDDYSFAVVQGYAYPAGVGIEVSDFTVDCNYDVLQPLTVAAIGHDTTNASIEGVIGRSGIIRNIRVIHSGGNNETFVVGLFSHGPVGADDAARLATAPGYSEISSCRVELPSTIHHNLTCIAINSCYLEHPITGGLSLDLKSYGGQAIIKDCVVDGGPYGTTSDPKVGIGVGISGFNTGLIEGCCVRNSQYGFFHDTSPQAHLTIANNIFEGVYQGIGHNGGLHQEGSFGHYHHNRIICYDTAVSLSSATNTTVEFNTIEPVAGATLAPSYAFIFFQDPAEGVEPVNNVYRYNRIHSDFQNVHFSRGDPQVYGNRYFDGSPIKNLKDNVVQQPAQ